MISEQKYLELKAKITAFDAWVDTKRDKKTGWASYLESEIPANLAKVTNDERSSVEVYEFCHNPPKQYLVYVRRVCTSPGVVHHKDVEVTTWTGQQIGKGELGRMYYAGKQKQHRRYPIMFTGINGHVYAGIYYASDGDYAKVSRKS